MRTNAAFGGTAHFRCDCSCTCWRALYGVVGLLADEVVCSFCRSPVLGLNEKRPAPPARKSEREGVVNCTVATLEELDVAGACTAPLCKYRAAE